MRKNKRRQQNNTVHAATQLQRLHVAVALGGGRRQITVTTCNTRKDTTHATLITDAKSGVRAKCSSENAHEVPKLGKLRRPSEGGETGGRRRHGGRRRAFVAILGKATALLARLFHLKGSEIRFVTNRNRNDSEETKALQRNNNEEEKVRKALPQERKPTASLLLSRIRRHLLQAAVNSASSS